MTEEPEEPEASGAAASLRFGWFGTSIMQHLEGYNAQLLDQTRLPETGSLVEVERHRHRGYVQRFALGLQADWPGVRFSHDNCAIGGATSRDLAWVVEQAVAQDRRYDLALLGCGVNDVWRRFQGVTELAVELPEYARNVRRALTGLGRVSRLVVSIAETPFGAAMHPDQARVARMNRELAAYNTASARIAAELGAARCDPWAAFLDAERLLPSEQTLWNDGVHLSELGDTLLLRCLERDFAERELVRAASRLR